MQVPVVEQQAPIRAGVWQSVVGVQVGTAVPSQMLWPLQPNWEVTVQAPAVEQQAPTAQGLVVQVEPEPLKSLSAAQASARAMVQTPAMEQHAPPVQGLTGEQEVPANWDV